MKITVQELADKLGGTTDSERGDEVITGVASVTDAGPGDLTFYSNRKYLNHLKSSKATAVLVPRGFSEKLPSVCIEVGNPSTVFAEVLKEVAPQAPEYTSGFHPTAFVHPEAKVSASASVQPHAVVEAGAEIGDNTVVGAGVFIGRDTRIGRDGLIYPNVSIRERVQIGDRVIIHCGAVIGSDGYGFEFEDGRHVKIPQIGIVQIDDDVEIGANTTIDRARFGKTWVQEGTKIDNLVQIGHNVEIGKHSLLVSHVAIGGSTKIGNYVTLAGQVGVAGHLEVGDQVVAAGQSGITSNLPAKSQVFCTPAIPISDARRQIAAIHRLPDMLKELKSLRRKVKELADSSGKK